MAKDDYHVIVYQVLSYLYQCLKNGEEVDSGRLQPKGLFDIDEKYWLYIIEHMKADGLIEGFEIHRYINGHVGADFTKAQITPAGIGYLLDNNLMAKAKRFLKDMNGIMPF